MKAVLSMIPQLIRASIENDMRTVESSALTILRKLKTEEPAISAEIAKALSYHGVGAAVTRSVGIDPPPTDRDTFMSLARVEEPNVIEPKIVLSEENSMLIDRFIKERSLAEKLLAAGVTPPTSLLLYGPPGVGKTFLTSLLSHKLGLPLITLDLASSISSYLGKTGQNLKKVIEYAQSAPSILFLDEFDAVAKRRDDPGDLGELKRIVNVLLKELENWPIQSIVVAATNHADMLDKAIWRRFDRAIEIGLPDLGARKALWLHYLGSYLNTIDEDFILVLAKVTEGKSAADISQLSERIIRQVIVDDIEPIQAVIYQLKSVSEDNKFNSLFAKTAKDILGKKVTQKTIANWLGISPSTLSHHINTNKEE
ncbi:MULTISPECIES: ATP-binding protein [unclassified Paenibacillus]|uniref:AAA family ATPase n=1 Tax=unclassified Paenibacillus TaxID=185978 RepID=UPI0024063A9D|nr:MULTISPECIES: ATP-binding protein [unclassified Paenibacillus]MDF9841947.1 SpoVK/Ycf46/Vps4 family AAA+-type ATPase [Paenibacillus sp. PastF-2]MDF9848372.1 SpoVK/Ycf46/Vps4 family AAA+-type ATPase [Paenibacillus sp. PastM-2]MDF9855107.1 SpoVK/Ycf46/Vps4 family AAA+-type ATPase [Paenibacillus sp. PastF-1]MDH6480376.1 SpoVK/Ycf46/Vps4 family AAA+-type ATPase [Paenibacillus sp. PastH-2]MDH6507640.1 SpoVK/Ycf46/Vps4 family AAA+-type ATPase [Paenibacillus sp. PastM-3]